MAALYAFSVRSDHKSWRRLDDVGTLRLSALVAVRTAQCKLLGEIRQNGLAQSAQEFDVFLAGQLRNIWRIALAEGLQVQLPEHVPQLVVLGGDLGQTVLALGVGALFLLDAALEHGLQFAQVIVERPGLVYSRISDLFIHYLSSLCLF